MWGNWKPHTLLVGKENNTATWENSLAVPQKTEESYHMTSNSTLKLKPKNNENLRP